VRRTARPLAFALALACAPALAVLPDEIQVYTDDLEKPGEHGVELHINTTPRGRTTPDFPGEVVPDHGLRVTPEISWGINRDMDWGLYLPFSRDAAGSTRFGGPKLRFKWLPLRPEEGGAGWFAGVNLEYAWLTHGFESGTRAFELRPILGYRNRDWLLAANPILSWQLNGPERGGSPEFSPAFKLARSISPPTALGIETYSGLGRLNEHLPHAEQAHTLYFTVDHEAKNWGINFGIGRGLTSATDRWTIKTILSLPFP